MIAKKDENLLEATETLYTLNADELVRRQCEARADYYRLHNSINRRMEELLLEKENAVEENKKLNSEVKILNYVKLPTYLMKKSQKKHRPV